MSDEKKEGGFCTNCGFRIESFEGLNGCPSCGTTNPPCADSEQVTISINWHELRILCIWAENWQRDKVKDSKVVYSIAKRIKDQYPERIPLTLAAELGDVAKEFKGLSVGSQALREDIIEQTGQEPGLIDPQEGGPHGG